MGPVSSQQTAHPHFTGTLGGRRDPVCPTRSSAQCVTLLWLILLWGDGRHRPCNPCPCPGAASQGTQGGLGSEPFPQQAAVRASRPQDTGRAKVPQAAAAPCLLPVAVCPRPHLLPPPAPLLPPPPTGAWEEGGISSRKTQPRAIYSQASSRPPLPPSPGSSDDATLRAQGG